MSVKLRRIDKTIRLSQTKSDLVNALSEVLADGSTVQARTIIRTRKVPTLSSLSLKVVAKIPKQVLVLAKAVFEFPHELYVWTIESPVRNSIRILENEPFGWFYRPTYSIERQQLEIRCLDATHLFTNLRAKTCRGGIKNIDKRAWQEVANTRETELKPAIFDLILDQQSISMARTHFGKDVENKMTTLGFTAEAHPCSIV